VFDPKRINIVDFVAGGFTIEDRVLHFE